MTGKIPVVAFLTDFGSSDFYAAAMKGVILKTVKPVQFVDISHEVPSHNIRWGAFQLFSTFRDFPAGTLFVCVVDPGVGSDRKILYAEAGSYKFIGPDNGILSWVFQVSKPKTVLAINPEKIQGKISRTFQGRDIMAPVAGEVLKGKITSNLGSPLKSWVSIPFPAVQKTGSKWVGEVMGVDKFGNVITSFRSEEVAGFAKKSKVWFDFGMGRPTVRGLSPSYASVEKGRLLAIEGSTGFIEISAREANAAQKLGLTPGDKINLMFRL